MLIRPATLLDADAIVCVQTKATQQAYQNVLPLERLPDQIDYEAATARRRQKMQQELDDG
jgi:hypothetical protein